MLGCGNTRGCATAAGELENYVAFDALDADFSGTVILIRTASRLLIHRSSGDEPKNWRSNEISSGKSAAHCRVPPVAQQ
jgi:hypothetical protein